MIAFRRLFPFFSMDLGRRALWTGRLTVLVVLGSLAQAAPSQAAEEVVLTYGPLQAALSLQDLTALSRTGQASQSLGFYLGLAGVDPATARRTLNAPLPLSQAFLDDLMHSSTGDRLLTRLVDVVHTSSREGSIPALRSAIVLSAGGDQQITLLELIQNYPTPQMYIDAANLMTLMQEISAAQHGAEQS